jgi:signal transduction histidine kinase
MILLRRRAADLAALAVIALGVVCAARFDLVHRTGPDRYVVLSSAVLVILVAGGSIGLPSARRVCAVGVAVAWLPLVVIAPSFAWCAVPVLVLLHAVLGIRTATAASAVVVVAAAVSVPRLTTVRDPGLLIGCLLAGAVIVVALAALRSALVERGRLLRDLVAARSRMLDAERRASALAARQEVAAELHDTVVQSAAGALFLVEAAERTAPSLSPAGREARIALRAALSDARGLVDRLERDGTEHTDLVTALSAVATGAGATLHVSGDEQETGPAAAHALVRIVQSAVANAVRHARATTIVLALHRGERCVSVTVSDDGRGFDPDAVVVAGPDGGHGLAIIRRRIALLGGTLSIDSSPGAGTSLTATIPVEDR